jgi:hypothetical protein
VILLFCKEKIEIEKEKLRKEAEIIRQEKELWLNNKNDYTLASSSASNYMTMRMQPQPIYAYKPHSFSNNYNNIHQNRSIHLQQDSQIIHINQPCSLCGYVIGNVD